MGANSEDYLDSLLNSLSKEKEERPSYPNLFRSAEEDFLRDFEREILADEDLDYLKEFEQELGVGASSSGFASESLARQQAKPVKQHEESAVEKQLRRLEEEASRRSAGRREENPLDADDIISGLKSKMGNAPSSEPVLEESKIKEFTLSSDENPAVNLMPEGKVELDGEPDLSGQADSGLLDLLKGNEDFAELGDMLDDSFEVNTLDSSNEIDTFMQKEMKEQAAQSSEESDEEDTQKSKKKERRKKKDKKEKKDGSKKEKGGLSKFFSVLFGSDEEEEEKVNITSVSLDGDLTDENMQILAELEAAEKQEEPKKKDKKEKKKKEKKEKPKKEKAPKQKKEKPKKEKKEKPPKEKDNTKPLPKAPVILIMIMVASMTGLVLLGTSVLSYQPNLEEAKSLYTLARLDFAKYEEANQCLQGLKIKEKDEQFYQQTCIMAAIASEYQAYQTFLSHNMQDAALDSLICALGRCEVNREAAETYECIPELENLEQEIASVLGGQYGVSAERALEIYRLRDRDKYTQQVYQILREAGLL